MDPKGSSSSIYYRNYVILDGIIQQNKSMFEGDTSFDKNKSMEKNHKQTHSFVS